MTGRRTLGRPEATIRLVATDLDGTLLDPAGEVTARTVAAVAAARHAGVHVIPVTGRPPQAMWEIAHNAGLGPLGVCSNGAAIVDIERRSVIEVNRLGADVASGFVDLVRAAEPDIRLACDSLECFTYEAGFFDGPVDWQEELQSVPDLRPVVASDGCVKMIGRVPGLSALELIRRLEREIGEEGHVTTSGLDWVDIGPPGVSKAYAVERVIAHLDVSVEEVAAVGDNHNDLSVLAWAGHAFAPANAVTDVLALVERVLPANADDGVAQLLEELAAARAAG